MQTRSSHRRAVLVMGLILACCIIFIRCIREKAREAVVIVHPNGQRYAGDESCKSCHRAIYASFLSTAHYLTSRVAERKYIKGSFTAGGEAGGNIAPGNVPGGDAAGGDAAGAKNEYVFDPHWKVVMEEHADGFYQTAYRDGRLVESERFDIVMGTGKHGQTYIYNKGGELYQLPISYFTAAHSWANSPGYMGHEPFFERPIEVRCMQCHTTFSRQTSSYGYDPDRIMYGVGCERCHGPAGKHVEYQTQHPEDRKGKFIVNPAALARQQSLDVCALCHSGVMRSTAPAWSFLPGDTLAHYFQENSSHIDSVNLDVHANQYGLLTASKCFRISGTMVCSTCHNTHVKENGDMAAYGQKCMSCHAPVKHDFTPPTGFSMEGNCVNCHMPVRASKKLGFMEEGHVTVSPEMVRSHRIAIYRDVTEMLLKKDQ